MFRRNAFVRYEAIVRPLVPRLFQVAYRLAGDRETAEDLVQDLIVKLYDKAEEVIALDKPEPWLIKVMYRMYLDQVRRTKRSPVTLLSDLQNETHDGQAVVAEYLDPAPGPLTMVENQRLADELCAALDRLSEEFRAVVLLHDVEGYALAEIEQILDLPSGTIKSRLHRARAKLRIMLEGTDPSPAACITQGAVK